MKKFYLALAVILIFSTPTYSAEWRHSPLKEFIGQGDHYLLELPQASCAVIAYSDGKTDLFANDSNWDGIAVTQKITLDSQGKKSEETEAIERKYPHKKRKGYKVYVAKCKPYFEGLPPEVQKRLAGL